MFVFAKGGEGVVGLLLRMPVLLALWLRVWGWVWVYGVLLAKGPMLVVCGIWECFVKV